MHLLSSPAHLFSMVLLSIVLGAMTMAVPLTVRDTDIGKWQWLSKREDRRYSVVNVRLVRREDASAAALTRSAKTSLSLDSQEHWYLYISDKHGFHAVQEDGLWQLEEATKRNTAGLMLGTINAVLKYPVPKRDRLTDLYSKITKITNRSNQFEALDHLIELLTKNTINGLTYNPREGDPDTWRKIFLAMTDYKKYLEEFPYVNERYTNRQYKPEQPAASISGGGSGLPTTSGGQPGGKLGGQGDEEEKQRQRIEDEEKEKQRIKDEQEKEKQRIEDEGKQRQRIKGQMDINSVLG